MINLRTLSVFLLIATVAAQYFPRPNCGLNAEWKLCAPCQDGCDQIYNLRLCTAECKPSECGCIQNYLRDPRTGQCVPANQCPTPDVWDYKNNKPVCDGMKSFQKIRIVIHNFLL